MLGFGIERSGSPKSGAGIDQPVDLALPFSTVRRETVAIGASFDDVVGR